MVTDNAIKKFMDRLGVKVVMFPHQSSNNICIHCKVIYKNITQYYVEDCYGVNENGQVFFVESEMNVGSNDGVFAYLGDDEAVDNFFLDVTQAYAQKFIDNKIKSPK